MIDVNGVSLYVEEHGSGEPVVLLHGWPDSGRLWQHQVPSLVSRGFRVIVPDLRGLGRSERPADVGAYAVQNSVADVTGILDALGLDDAHVVGHDWGAIVAWFTAMLCPERVRRLVILSVPHPLVPHTARQNEMYWYHLFFQFAEIAEATIQYDDWAWLRKFGPEHPDLDQVIADLSRPGALTAGLNWYRANRAPRMPAPPVALPPVKAPTLGIWSTGDRYLDGARMDGSAAYVDAQWRYEQIPEASHWIPVDAPERLTQLLLEWLG
jgi:pimeloyl-ACP methyl ester carboxylesterase